MYGEKYDLWCTSWGYYLHLEFFTATFHKCISNFSFVSKILLTPQTSFRKPALHWRKLMQAWLKLFCPVRFLHSGTFSHYLHRPWAALWRVHPASTGDKLQHLLISLARIRHVTKREYLPQQHSKWPAGGDTDPPLSRRHHVCHILKFCSRVPQWE